MVMDVFIASLDSCQWTVKALLAVIYTCYQQRLYSPRNAWKCI